MRGGLPVRPQEHSELHTLELGSNCLQHVACASLSALEELWLSGNKMASAEDIAEVGQLPRLKTLYLSGCPISQTPGYRDTCLRIVPSSLSQLDADELPADWRRALDAAHVET